MYTLDLNISVLNIYVLFLHPSLYYTGNLVVCALEIHISVSNTSSQILPVTRTILHCIILGQGLGTRNFFSPRLQFFFFSFLFHYGHETWWLVFLFYASYSLESAHSKTANKWPPQIASDLIQNVVKFFLPIFPPSSNVTLLRLCTAQCWLNKKWRLWYFLNLIILPRIWKKMLKHHLRNGNECDSFTTW